MIELKDLRKSYNTGGFEQRALDGVSMSFRDNEFVAILGTSGSGKTTLLNVIGGLDHADSGEIIVNGISTKNYRPADWDAYRNHEIGFIFQSYNLIPHQTVLSNVELALTLSGMGKAERKKLALSALEKVGLADHASKKPNQLSGGQAQRVAIARAIVNNPSIILADEPTGALDTETGIQVMEILKGISQEHLVVMVTHNPELAGQYADRIINLKDGKVVSDTDPVSQSGFRKIPLLGSPRRRKRAGMGFVTALGLSFSNLMSKKGRTFMTALAGSIGIIGIASILALSNGVNNYIVNTEEEALSSYPLTITKSSFDISSLLTATMGYAQGKSADGSSSDPDPDLSDPIPETSMMADMFTSVKNNDLSYFKEYLDSGNTGMEPYVSMIRYRYDVTPNVYASDTSSSIVQLNPSKAMSSISSGLMSSAFSLGSGSSNSFSEMMDNDAMLQEQLDIVAGRWPESYDECMLVLDRAGEISDYSLYAIGVYDNSEMQSMMRAALSGDDVQVPVSASDFTYEDALDLTFKVLPASSLYQQNEEQGIWADISDNEGVMRERLDRDAIELRVVGVVKPSDDFSGNPMSEGIAYRTQLTYELMEIAADSDIVREQKEHTHHDVFSGKSFDELNDASAKKLDMEAMFSIDEDKLRSSFSMDTSAFDFSDMDFDMGSLAIGNSFDMSSLSGSMDANSFVLPLDENSIRSIMSNAPIMSADELVPTDGGDFQLSEAQKQAIDETSSELAASFGAWMLANNKTMPQSTSEYAELFQEYMSDGNSGAADIIDKLESEFGDDIRDRVESSITTYMQDTFAPYMASAMETLMRESAQAITAQMTAEMTRQMGAMTQSMGTAMSNAISGQLQAKMSEISKTLQDGFSFDAAAFADAVKVNMSQEDLTSLLMSYMNSEEASYESNLSKLGYAELSSPQSISIYAKDFEAKDHITDIIDAYNDGRRQADDAAHVIQYSDIAGVLMSSVTDIVNTISAVLIAFVSISLVVSSIMIGIITYISVLERKKEIGILRAMGASKGNIGSVFNAETVIEGLISGVLAISVILAASVPVNILVEDGFDVPNVMALPPNAALVLIGISVLLTFVAGLIPSQSASRRDPVEALRSE